MKAKINKAIRSLAAIIVLLMISSSVHLVAQSNTNSYSSLVIVKIDQLTNKQYHNIAKHINNDMDMTLEYSCKESSVLVIKLRHNHDEKGDVQHFINSQLKKWSEVKMINFVYIDINKLGTSKC